MNSKGFSLIELVITIMIIGILSLALGTSLQGTMASYRIEGQLKEMHADLTNARSRAMQRNRIYFAQIAANNYQITEDTDQDGVLSGGDTNLFATPKLYNDVVVWGGGTILFNTRGVIATTVGALPANFQIVKDASTPGTPDYDCIVLTQTRVNMGRWNGGTATCDVK